MHLNYLLLLLGIVINNSLGLPGGTFLSSYFKESQRPVSKQSKWFGWENCAKFYCYFKFNNGTLVSNIPIPSQVNREQVPLCSDILELMLRQISSTLETSNIPFYITFGTLLGSFQIEDIFTYTHDLDLAMPQKYFESLLYDETRVLRSLDSSGLFIFRGGQRLMRVCPSANYISKNFGSNILAKTRMGVYVERFIYVDIYEEYEIRKGLIKVNPSECLFERNIIYPLGFCVVRNYFYPCPNFYGTFLEKHYGPQFYVSKDSVSQNDLVYFGCIVSK